ncbi:MAG TPA: hypothetical protein PLR41_02795 [Alphaproteobacteria bacterium]|nr:hypothetical protein [Alphaproteobacteria bacterium]
MTPSNVARAVSRSANRMAHRWASRGRRRRWLSLLLCQVFVLNLFAALAVDTRQAAANSFESILQSARCGEAFATAGAAQADSRQVAAAQGATRDSEMPRDQMPARGHSCPHCAATCTMGGGSTLGLLPAGASVAPVPGGPAGSSHVLHLVSVKPARLLSDAAAQGPPARRGSHAQSISVQS